MLDKEEFYYVHDELVCPKCYTADRDERFALRCYLGTRDTHKYVCTNPKCDFVLIETYEESRGEEVSQQFSELYGRSSL